MKPVTLNLKEHEHRKLVARAARAQMPFERYIVAAASDPLQYAWLEDEPPTANLES